MDKKEYAPKWLYHKDKGAVLLNSEAEEKALGSGWVDSPAGFKKAEKVGEKPSQEPEKAPKKAKK